MRALVLEDFGAMAVQERPVPVPGHGEALIRVLYTGICGSDLHGYTGENGRRFPGQIMGHESVGTVSAYGPDTLGELPELGATVTFNPTVACGVCSSCAAGQAHICPERRVIGVEPERDAAFADFIVVPVANLVELPAGVPARLGALAEPLAVGYHAAVRSQMSAGDIVTVIGAGPIGQAVVLAALRLGAVAVVVSEPDAGRGALATKLGAHVVSPENLVAAVDQLTGGLGSAVTIDAVGSSVTISTALTVTRRGGNCVLVGMHAPEPTIPAFRISTDERRLIGAFCYRHDEFADTVRWIAANHAVVETLITRSVPVEEAPEAFRSLADGDADASKILVSFE